MDELQKSGHVDDPMAVGRRLRGARERAGLSQAALAAVCGCSGAYVSRVEAGDRTPSLQLLRRLVARHCYTVSLRSDFSFAALGLHD